MAHVAEGFLINYKKKMIYKNNEFRFFAVFSYGVNGTWILYGIIYLVNLILHWQKMRRAKRERYDLGETRLAQKLLPLCSGVDMSHDSR